jgi:hypothetical protein
VAAELAQVVQASEESEVAPAAVAGAEERPE